MPQGTKVARCVAKVKKKGRSVNPFAVCQAATGQGYMSGRSLKHKRKTPKMV